MNRCSRSWESLLAGAGLSLLALDGAANSRRHSSSPAAQGAPHSSRCSTGPGSISARMPATAAAPRARVLTDPLLATTATNSTFSGMIGGVQAGYNFQTALRAAARRRSRSHLPELSHLEFDRRLAGDAAHRRRRAIGLCRNGARPRRLCHQSLAALCHRRAGLCRRAFRQLARGRRRRKESSTSGSAGPPAPASNMPSRRTGAVRLEYLYNRFENADIRLASGTQYSSTLDFQSMRVGLNRKIDWPGSPASLAEERR